MKLEDLTTIDQLTDFLSGTQAVAFSVINDKDAGYRWIQGELVKFRYLKLPRQGKGVVIRYLMKISGYSRQQLTRLIAPYRKTGQIKRSQRTVSGFKQKYTEQDMPADQPIYHLPPVRALWVLYDSRLRSGDLIILSLYIGCVDVAVLKPFPSILMGACAHIPNISGFATHGQGKRAVIEGLSLPVYLPGVVQSGDTSPFTDKACSSI